MTHMQIKGRPVKSQIQITELCGKSSVIGSRELTPAEPNSRIPYTILRNEMLLFSFSSFITCYHFAPVY